MAKPSSRSSDSSQIRLFQHPHDMMQNLGQVGSMLDAFNQVVATSTNPY